jgi:hypothetical protein
MLYISASMLDNFITCNRQAYYRLVRPDLAVQSREMIIGEIVHKTIELHWDNQDFANQYYIAEILQRLPDDKSALLHAQECLSIFFEVFAQYLTPEDEIEKKFKLLYDKDVYIVGKMDRISDGKIFDWKTTNSPPKNIDRSVQSIVYDWAYRKQFDKSPTGVYLASLSDGSLIKHNYNAIIADELMYEIVPNVIHAIKNKQFVRNGIFRKACFKCQYARSCLKEINDVLDNPVSS